MKNLSASLLCVLLAACAAPKFPLSPTHVAEPEPAAGTIPEPVQQSAALPPPRPAARQETYSVSVHRVPVQSVLFALARDAGLNVDVHPAVEGTVTLNALDQTLPQLLARIGKQVDMRYELQGNNLVVLPDQPYWNHYKIDYVNIARSTNSSVNIATQISTTGGSAYSSGGSPSNPVPTAGSSLGSGGNNNSTTSVANRSDNNFWYSLEKNVRDMLRPTTLNDQLTDPLAQMREQANAMMQQIQAGGGPAPSPDASYPGAQAAAAQARAQVGGLAGNTAFGPGASPQARNSPSVIANPEGGLLSVRATSRQHEKVQEFLDIIMSTAKRQVLIEATIIEVKLSDQYQQGINWARINGNGKLGQGQVGTTPLPSGVAPNGSAGIFIFDYANPTTRFGNITATIQLLESFGKVKVLSSPKISVLNNQTALLKVVDNSIFFTLKVTPAVLTSTGTIATPATYESRVETVPVGFVMSVTPQISAEDEVTLNVRPTITRIVDYVDDPNPELSKQGVKSRVPVIQAREMESILKVQSGQVAVMGGLMQDSVDNKRDSIPLIGSVPVLGSLFSYRNETASKTELVIFLRPVVVKDASLAGDYRNYRYLMPARPPGGIMSLLMQALRKAERARAQSGHDTEYGDDLGQAPFGADAVPSPPPIEGGPAFAVMPDSWRLEPLDAEPPVVAAQEAAHDPVPPQARHEPVRPPTAPSTPRMPPAAGMSDAPRTTRATGHAPDSAGVNASGGPGALRGQRLPRAIASSQRRLAILAGTLAALLAVFAFIYWRAVSAPGPGAQLPKVPMPAPGSPPAVLAGSQQGAPIPVTPYVTPLGADPGLQASPPAGAAATAEAAGTMAGGAAGAPGLIGAGSVDSGGVAPASPPSTAAKAPPTRPDADVTIPTPEQLAAITDPAIRAEAMRDAAERAARQVRAEGSAAPVPATVHEGPATQSQASEPVRTHRPESPVRRQGDTAAHKEAGATLKTAIGDTGNVQFVRGTAPAQIAPAVQNGYAALKSGDLATAHQQYDLALLQDPNNRDALLGAAAVALREHDGRQASSNYLRLLELDPNDPEALAGLAELRPGDLQENEIKLRGLARQHPGSGPVQFALGNLFARQGRWPEAQQSYFRAFNAMPENADYAFNLGVGLDRMNQPRLAQTYYRRALELAQASPPSFNIDAVRKRLQVLETPPQ